METLSAQLKQRVAHGNVTMETEEVKNIFVKWKRPWKGQRSFRRPKNAETGCATDTSTEAESPLMN
jgi:hypothetical protein